MLQKSQKRKKLLLFNNLTSLGLNAKKINSVVHCTMTDHMHALTELHFIIEK